MGLSASQARLLSITARLSDNELKSQQISNSKVRLADRTREASADYIAALDASKLMYSTYDAEGNAQKIDLSAAALYNYSPYKNQYTLVNTSNQILVSSLEAANFVETKNLYEFLDRYGLVDTVAMKELTANREAASIRQENLEGMKNLYDENSENPTYLKTEFMTAGYTTTDANGQVILNEDAQYYVNLAEYNRDQDIYAIFGYNSSDPTALLGEYKNASYAKENNDGTLSFFGNAEYYYNYARHKESYARYQDILTACQGFDPSGLFKTLVAEDGAVAGGCYNAALSGNITESVKCYAHLIAHLLDWDTDNDKISTSNYTSSLGDTFKIDFSGFAYDAYQSAMHEEARKNKDSFKIIIDSINLTEYRVCNGNDAIDGNTTNLLAKENVSEKDRLMSDFYFIADKNGKNYGDEGYEKTYAVKSVKQKLIDTLYLLQNQSNPEYELTTEDMQMLLKDLTEGDLSKVTVPKEPTDKIKFEEPNEAPEMPVYSGSEKPVKPVEPVKPAELKDIIILNDQAKGQWYVNLWYAMNGSDTANVVSTLSNEEAFNAFTTTKYAVLAASKNEGSANYAIFDDNLYKSAEWLQFALEQGIVTIQKATVFDPSEDNGKVLSASGEGIMWSRTPYTSCTDFVEVDDEVAIARAEAEYNQKLNDIQAQDKKLDNDLKKLDTEHNALQTEYESVKSVVNKNIERSFKAFS